MNTTNKVKQDYRTLLNLRKNLKLWRRKRGQNKKRSIFFVDFIITKVFADIYSLMQDCKVATLRREKE
jgi:hypothetical protein